MSVQLNVQGLSRHFGGIRAVDEVSFSTAPGQITGVIGPNGAGKTTLFNLIAGTTKPSAGVVTLDGAAITGRPAAALARQGVVRTFQMTHVFAGHTVLENLYRAALFRQFPSPWSLFNPWGVRRGREEAARQAEQALALIGLESVANEQADSLAYGLQKILGVGMALTAMPRLLLMDEPAAGLNPVETVAMADLIERIHASGIDVVVVEHDMGLVMRLCQKLVVLVNGRLLAEGPTAQVRQDPRVIEAYLGADLDKEPGLEPAVEARAAQNGTGRSASVSTAGQGAPKVNKPVPMLEIKDLSVSYGAVRALDKVSFAVEEASVCAVIGANGAGKSTLMKAISGLVPVAEGEIRLEGQPIQDLSAERRVTLGIALSPEGRRLFPELTVRENLLMGAYLRKDQADIMVDLERIYAYFPRLLEREQSQGRHLSGGEQQMCAIGRALMSRPRLLLLDEPSLGLAPAVTLEVARAIRQISQDGTTIVLVEQNARLALKLSQHAVVLETGRLSLSGHSRDIMNNPQIAAAYLGHAGESSHHA
ncbi:ATP-binding cassette domain-containing protein [Alcaligenes sp. HNGD-HTN06]|uniref:ATP-binding cassette domain-containing protein n=1 Tax=Alcaligenes sp. HNGD-HTN06 TaxID=3416924 RepID=UPI002CE482B7|nr:ATP-binding cassette domain-containing protein [Alcaligenes faecalis]